MDHGPNAQHPSSDHPIDDAWDVDRGYLLRVATKILGSQNEAEDVVQEAFSRLTRVDIDTIDDVRGWLAVVVRHIALDRIRSAYVRHESTAESSVLDGASSIAGDRIVDPADRITLDEQLQLALAIVLDRLSPGERTAFVLHDVFGFSFSDVGLIVGRTPAACRQQASRARRSIRSQGASATSSEPDLSSQRVVTERFIAACAGGDLTALMAVLDPDVVGVATLIDHGPIVRLEGRDAVASRVVALFGPTSRRSLLPVAVENKSGAVAFDGERVAALIVFDEANGLIHHIHTFVRPLPKR
ncbi:MAG: polymerase sigma-70 factor, subfamily [Ilumatobacteraceae bacterium]|nr:polymerase sigma-70 factor, subfamily [Ilumatobacteraceae bacterium]